MVIQEGFEPPTHGLEGRCSIQLSYWTACYRPYSLTTSVYHIRTASENGQKNGAGEGNRTLVTSLEGWGSTIELHPQHGRSSRIRTCDPLVPSQVRYQTALCPVNKKPSKMPASNWIMLNFCRIKKMVGTTGFEPATSWSRTRRATKLRYVP